jgi:small subunit ribosomal protein S17
MVEMVERTSRKEKTGVVTKDKMDKTRVVEVMSRFKHPRYSKIMSRRAKFYVHDEKNEAHAGDKVLIMETRPLSKQKRWRLVKILEKA